MRFLVSLSHAWRGIRTVWSEERNFRIQAVSAVAVLIIAFAFDFSFIEKVSCIFAITLVLTAEAANTALEDLCNKIEPGHDIVIGKIKDVASGFVLISGFGAAAAGVLVFLHHFFLI